MLNLNEASGPDSSSRRACPRTIQLDEKMIGVVFYDVDPKQEGGPGLFFLKIPLKKKYCETGLEGSTLIGGDTMIFLLIHS